MRRIAIASLVAVSVALTPLTAFAQEGSGLNPPGGPDVIGTGGSMDPGGLAFTGAETLQLVALSLALLVVGIGAIVLTRRNRTARLER